jgi:hypothetical protein
VGRVRIHVVAVIPQHHDNRTEHRPFRHKR